MKRLDNKNEIHIFRKIFKFSTFIFLIPKIFEGGKSGK